LTSTAPRFIAESSKAPINRSVSRVAGTCKLSTSASRIASASSTRRAELLLGARVGTTGDEGEPAGERTHQLRVAASDPAEPDDREGRAAQLEPEVRAGIPTSPAASAQIGLGLAHAPGGGQGEGKRELGGRVREHVRRIGHGDAAPTTRLEIDPVVADGEVGHDPEPGPRGLQQRLVDRHRGVGDDRVRTGSQLHQALAIRVQPALPDLALRGEAIPPRRQQPAGDQHGGACLGRVRHRPRRRYRPQPWSSASRRSRKRRSGSE
jgi:hypothetical protein